MTEQPKWKLVANLGDVNPIDHGGYFVYEDETGVYPPEGEKIEVIEDSGKDTWYVWRFMLEKLADVDGRLVLASLALKQTELPHPIEDYEEWFVDSLGGIAQYAGYSVQQMRKLLCSDSFTDRARAYEAIGLYHGFDNLDGYPLVFTNRAEVEARYKEKNQ